MLDNVVFAAMRIQRSGLTSLALSYGDGEEAILSDSPSERTATAEPLDPNTAHHCLIKAPWRRHAGLDRQAGHVLPTLLQQRDKVVNSQHDIANQLVLGHINVSDGDTHAQNLFQLELDGGLDFGDLGLQIVGVRDGRRELASLGQTGAEETGNLLDEGIGSDEHVVLARQLLDQLLVLVQLLQVVSRHGVEFEVLRAVDVVLVAEDADGHVRAGDLWEFDGAGETLVTLRVIVLEADLEFDRLQEVSLLGVVAVFQQLLDVAANLHASMSVKS